eukprot:TRINITY_DN12663_c0_g1_i1.p2 TRINITY_DN12663_c0_g1~~TRINITY_DN12663_c0_g1_i1.p2  ORF type:complete len:132 (+),score=47.81 TRINITY_DN12663_c0_g1_i1:444-839(+)
MTENLGGEQTWQKAFGTRSAAVAEAACHAAGMTWEWVGEELHVMSAQRPAILPHTGLWFNQAHNPFSFEPHYGDGTPVEAEVMEHLNATLWGCAVGFRWQRGDVLCLDNERALHARLSFEGPRRIVCAFGA